MIAGMFSNVVVNLIFRKEDTTMRNLERQIETLELSNRALQKQLQDAKRHKGSLERHISDLKDNDMELRTQLENSEIKRTELEAGVNVWKMENDKLQLRLALFKQYFISWITKLLNCTYYPLPQKLPVGHALGWGYGSKNYNRSNLDKLKFRIFLTPRANL